MSDLTLKSGTTSVSLNFDLLESAAGLTFVRTNDTVDPFSDAFDVGFSILEATDFSFDLPFAPDDDDDDSIKHSGTITLALGEQEVTLGEFDIRYDEDRISDTASGFFVADTLNDALGLEILFDVAVTEENLEATTETLTISEADLLIAPEFAQALGNNDLTGNDVGDTRIDALVEDEDEDDFLTIESGTTSVSLNFDLLESAAGLTFVRTNDTVDPFSDAFDVGFSILEATDFSFDLPFAPDDDNDSIKHSGTITFALEGEEVTLGEFDIRYDEDRASNTASGFFVADTLDDALGLEILFDVAVTEENIEATTETLTISEADLLIAPEFAQALGDNTLAGTDVGDTRIDADKLDDDPLLDTKFIRFRNNAIPGTYLYATGEEVQRIRDEFASDFTEEGVAFEAATEADDDLVALTRLQSRERPGTYLFVRDEELENIQNDPNLSNAFTVEGIAFYIYGAEAERGTSFSRFRNDVVSGTYLYATGEEAQRIRDEFASVFTEEGNAFGADT